MHPTLRLWLVFWLSAAILAFEITLMRLLLVVSWHHFAFLVISIALLGFGASGTILTFARRWVARHERGFLWAAAVAAGLSMPLCTQLAQLIDVEARIVPTLLGRQLGRWLIYWGLLTIPFLLGAMGICAGLMGAGRRIAGVYAGNLLGSAAGAVAIPVVMGLVDPERLPAIAAFPAFIGAAGLTFGWRRSGRSIAAAGAAFIMLLGTLSWSVPLRTDPHKYGAYLDRLVRQGSAQRLWRGADSHGLIEAYASDAIHDLPFLGPGAAPPPLTALVVDGHWAGSVLDVDTAEEAAVVDQTLMSFGYALGPRAPRVALLGEIGGMNIWLAARHQAARIDVVQPYPLVPALLTGPLLDRGGVVAELEAVHHHIGEPRHLIEHASGPYDLIQLASLEGSAAGSGGVGGMGENHLMTVEGVQACLDQLSGDGVLMVCRGIQEPPRDNLKLIATFITALRRRGLATPEDHLLVVRDFLAVCTLVKTTAWSKPQIERVRRLCLERELTPIWFTGIEPGELNRPDALPGPPGEPGDWYHHATVDLLDQKRAEHLIGRWRYDIRPPTDDRPFFADFCRVRSVNALREAYGELWLTRSELAFLFVLAAAAVIAGVGAICTILPLRWLPRPQRGAAGLGTAGFFAAIGLGYLMLEMACLSRLTQLIGDPVTAAAVTIGGFLVFSGLGSVTAQQMKQVTPSIQRRLMIGLIVIGAAAFLVLRVIPSAAGGLPEQLRCLVALLTIAPLAYLMGFPMPLGLRRLSEAAPESIPWAWGVNGFASVLAPPLAIALAMTVGYTSAATAALALYALAALIQHRLPSSSPA